MYGIVRIEPIVKNYKSINYKTNKILSSLKKRITFALDEGAQPGIL